MEGGSAFIGDVGSPAIIGNVSCPAIIGKEAEPHIIWSGKGIRVGGSVIFVGDAVRPGFLFGSGGTAFFIGDEACVAFMEKEDSPPMG